MARAMVLHNNFGPTSYTTVTLLVLKKHCAVIQYFSMNTRLNLQLQLFCIQIVYTCIARLCVLDPAQYPLQQKPPLITTAFM